MNPHVATKAVWSLYIEINLVVLKQPSTVDCITIWLGVGSFLVISLENIQSIDFLKRKSKNFLENLELFEQN